MIKVRFKEDGEIPDFEIDFNEKEINKMEEKYRKLAVDLGIKREDEDDCCAMPSTRLTGLERENEELKEKISLLTDVIVFQRKRINMLEESREELESVLDDKESEELALREEIETLKKIIDKCNTTYTNAKTQVVLDGTVKAVEECVKQRSKKNGND